MKATILARPNLKLFLVCALGLLALQHLMTARGSSSILVAERTEAGGVAWEMIDDLVARSLEQPAAETYMLISECYRQRGDAAQAMRYLRKAVLAAEIEDQ